MNIPKELVEKWCLEWKKGTEQISMYEHIAQRAAEWALSNVSMEPKQQVKETPVHKIDGADWPEPDSGFAKLEAL